MVNLILCGGSGNRLWPISRENYPKQFLQIFNNESIFQKTIKRNLDLADKFLIVSNENQYFTALDQIHQLNLDDKFLPSIIEPFGKNTAASIAFGAFSVDEEEILFITPSDHLIEKDTNYKNIVEKAKEIAKEDYIVTFGIKPNFAATSYGYIKAYKNKQVSEIIEFKEKPSKEIAKKYLNDEKYDYLWNSGMFMVKARIYLEELQKYATEIYEMAKKAFLNAKRGEFIRVYPQDMEKIPENSIDYAIMEYTKRAKVIKSDIKWRDIGTFDSLYEVLEKDEFNNTKVKKLYQINSKNNLLFGKYRTFALSHIEDMIIIDTPTALLVAKRGESEGIKKLVNIIKKDNPDIIKYGRTVYKPWGKFTTLEVRDKFIVKTLTINPNKRLSLQKHLHRSEHWTVVSGTALIRKGNEEFLLRPNESTFIPIGVVHRISNIGKIPVVIVEVQVGEYLDESDIIRLEDDYGRV